MQVVGLHLDDVLDLATRVETNGAEFYELAARSTQDAMALQLLTGLAAMERAHQAAFSKLRERNATGAATAGAADPEVDDALSAYLASWLEGEVFDRDRDTALAVARSGTMADVLRVAIRMEKDSIALYTGLMEYVADDEAERVLDGIITDELRHVADLTAALRQTG